MHQKGKIAGMDIRVGPSIIVRNMLAREIMFAVQLEVLICSALSVIYIYGCGLCLFISFFLSFGGMMDVTVI
jgi:hypothetical protein